MNVTHQLLDSGYHHVRAVGYAHLFAQWPVGMSLSAADVSDNGVGALVRSAFMSAAQAAADADPIKSEIMEQRAADLRARLSLESRDEPRYRSADEQAADDAGVPLRGPL